MIPRHRSRSLWRIVLVLAAAVLAAGCHRSQSRPHSFDGTWVMKLGDRVFIVMKLERQQNGSFTGSISAPKTFELPMGKELRFSHITLPVTEKRILSASANGAALRLNVQDPGSPGEPDILYLTLKGDDEASLQIVDLPVKPFQFARVRGGAEGQDDPGAL